MPVLEGQAQTQMSSVMLSQSAQLQGQPQAQATTVVVSQPDLLAPAILGPRGQAGAPGEKGDIGETMVVGGSYIHDQALPSQVWTVQHGLGFKPMPAVFDTAGESVQGGWTVVWPSTDVLILTFPYPFAGSCHVS